MSEKRIGEIVLTWLKNVGQFLVNIKMLLAVLPVIGISVGYFSHDNIKSAVSEPKIDKPVVENVAYVTPPPVKDYDLIINELTRVNRAQSGEIKALTKRVNKLEAHSVEIDSRFGALKTWVGWKE